LSQVAVAVDLLNQVVVVRVVFITQHHKHLLLQRKL
jgi:hypothetical protein